VDTEQLADALRHLMREHGIAASTANIAVAGSAVVVRCVKLPKMSESALRKSIKFEAGKYVPSSIDDSYIEFEILGDTDEGKMDVLVVAAPKEMVESRVTAIRLAGLDTEIVDIEGFALYRSLVEFAGDSPYTDQTIALVDMGAAHTHISVVSNGQFALARSIPIAGATLTDALQTYFRTTAEEAEAAKYALDFAALANNDSEAKENAALRLLQPIVDELVREIRRSVNYYQTQQTDSVASPVGCILLSGGSSQLPGIDAYLAHKLGLSCDAIGVWSSPRLSLNTGGDGGGHEYGVATGLAMRRAGRQAVAA
jgi:type IV pilus assembly protein PilM